MGYSLSMIADFQNGLICRIFGVLYGADFCRQQMEMIFRMDFDMFFGILDFDPKCGICMGYSLCTMADCQNGVISRIFGVFWSSFYAQNKCK